MEDYQIAQDVYENYRYCYDNGHREWLDKARVCFEFWRGNQWDANDRKKLAAAGRPALTFNTIESLLRTMKGMQCALRNDVRFIPAQHAGMDDARVHDAIWMHVQNRNQLEFLETEVYERGLVFNRAYYDVRINTDESMQGHVKITAPRSQDVLLDPAALTYKPDDWPQVLQRRWVSKDDIAGLYGKHAAKEIRGDASPDWFYEDDVIAGGQLGGIPHYRNNLLSDDTKSRAHLLLERQYYQWKMKDVFIDIRTGDVSEIPEHWEHNQISALLEKVPTVSTIKRNTRTVRWVVTCEDLVLHNADSPYKWFTIVPYFPTFLDGVSIGAVESLIDPQMLYNKVTSQELHVINTTANSGYKVKQGSLKNMTLEELEESGAKSGAVFELDDINNLEKIQPNSTPQGHDRISFKADAIMRSIAGVSNQARGFAREDVAGEAILANQAAQDVNAAGWLANLHRTKQLLASRVLDCVQAYYAETRVIAINKGSVHAPKVEEITINQPTPEGGMINDVAKGSYTTVLVPSPSRTSMSEADFKLLLEMRKVGVAIPDALLIELSPAANKGQIIQALQGDSNERQRAAEEAEAQAQQLEQQLAMAKARKEEAAAMLNQARAEKAAVDASTDPDAAYLEVETKRIEFEQNSAAEKLRLERDRLEADKQHQTQQLALSLAKLDNDKQAAAKPSPMQRKSKT